MSEPTIQEVIDAINQGISRAQEDYKNANDSDIISEYCPEYYLTIYIFQALLKALLKLKREYEQEFRLSVEESVWNMKKQFKIRGRPPDFISRQGRCDLALKDQDDNASALIEVKKCPFDYQENIERLAYFVSCGLKYGVFASCMFEEVIDNKINEAQDKLKENSENIRKCIQNLIRGWKYDLLVKKQTGEMQEFREESKIYEWCPVCFVICAKRTINT